MKKVNWGTILRFAVTAWCAIVIAVDASRWHWEAGLFVILVEIGLVFEVKRLVDESETEVK